MEKISFISKEEYIGHSAESKPNCGEEEYGLTRAGIGVLLVEEV